MNIPWFHKKTHLDEKQLEKLEDMLRTRGTSLHLPTLSRQKKDRIRAHMFERIDALSGVAQQQLPLLEVIEDGGHEDSQENEALLIDRLTTWIRESSQEVKLDPVKKAVIREHLYDLPEPVRAGNSFLDIFASRIFRRVVASVSLSGILGLTIFTYALRVPVTFAKEMTVVHEIEGSVNVVRGGKELPVTKGFELQEGDTVVTGGNGKVVVTYFDKSITRFFENTSVSFDALRSENFGFDHEVSLRLAQGMIWSNVIDYVANSEFKVQANGLIASASKRATFSLSSEQNLASLQVFHNLVNVEIPSKSEERTVVKGFQVTAHPERAQQIIEPIALKEDQKQWVAANLVSDQQVIGEVEKGNTGIVAGPLNKLQENASLLLAFDQNERFRLELNIAEKSFYETLKQEGATVDNVRVAFDLLQNVVQKADTLRSEDSKKLAHAVVQSARGELLSMKPDSQLYDLKIVLEDREFSSASEDRKLGVALDQASRFITEAQDLQEKGLRDAARKALRKYEERMKDAGALVALATQKKLPLDDSLVAKRATLERLFVAFQTPASNIVLPSSTSPVSGIASRPVDPSSTSSTALAPAATRPTDPAAATEPSSPSAPVETTPVEDPRAPVDTAVDEEVQPNDQLPPKLQISRD